MRGLAEGTQILTGTFYLIGLVGFRNISAMSVLTHLNVKQATSCEDLCRKSLLAPLKAKDALIRH